MKGAYGEIVIRCARRCNDHQGGLAIPRCPKFATHIVGGYALCYEHATGVGSNGRTHNKHPRKAKPHPEAVPVQQILEYLDSLGVPGLCVLKLERIDGTEGVGGAREAEAEQEVSEHLVGAPRR